MDFQKRPNNDDSNNNSFDTDFLLLWRTLTYLKSINKNIVAFAKIVNMKK